MKRLALTDYDYIAKTLSVTIYRTHYVTDNNIQSYRQFIEKLFNHHQLAKVLASLPTTIGANILHSSKQAYDPHGASVTIMLEEAKNVQAQPTAWVAHLDKSHITAHTYPERMDEAGVFIFRTDLEVSTCGLLTPLLCLNAIFNYFKPDVALIDYRLRGFIRDEVGNKDFNGEVLLPIEEYLQWPTRSQYQHQHEHKMSRQIYHTRFIKKPGFSDACLFASENIDEMHYSIETEKMSLFV